MNDMNAFNAGNIQTLHLDHVNIDESVDAVQVQEQAPVHTFAYASATDTRIEQVGATIEFISVDVDQVHTPRDNLQGGVS